MKSDTGFARLLSAQAEQARVNADLESFIFAAAHDLKEPLRGTRNSVEMVMNNDVSEELRVFFRENAFLEIDRGLSLVDDLLDYGKAGRPVKLGTVDVREEIDMSAESLLRLIAETKATIVVDIRRGGKFMSASSSFLRIALANLISNSIKYAKPGQAPDIKITSWGLANCVCVSVQDNGIGIEKQYVGTVHKPFQKLHSREEHRGSGFGLSIVDRLVRAHKGELIVSSPGLGMGATVEMRIPK